MKKLKPIPPEVKLKRRLKKYCKRLLYLSIAVAAYFLILPRLMPNSAPQVEKTKQTVLSAKNQAQTKFTQILGIATQIGNQLSNTSEQLTPEKAEEAVKKQIEELKLRLKSIPAEQAKKVKRDFCADVIKEAAEATPSAD